MCSLHDSSVACHMWVCKATLLPVICESSRQLCCLSYVSHQGSFDACLCVVFMATLLPVICDFARLLCCLSYVSYQGCSVAWHKRIFRAALLPVICIGSYVACHMWVHKVTLFPVISWVSKALLLLPAIEWIESRLIQRLPWMVDKKTNFLKVKTMRYSFSSKFHHWRNSKVLFSELTWDAIA